MASNVIKHCKDFKTDGIEDYCKKAIEKAINENKNTRVIFQCPIAMHGHGARPFGCNPFPNDYIDFDVTIGDLKLNGIGKNDIAYIAVIVEKVVKSYKNKLYRIKPMPFLFGEYIGNFVDSDDSLRYILFPEPCKEFFALEKYFNERSSNLFDGFKDMLFEQAKYGKEDYVPYDSEFCTRMLEQAKKICKGKRNRVALTIDDYFNVHCE